MGSFIMRTTTEKIFIVFAAFLVLGVTLRLYEEFRPERAEVLSQPASSPAAPPALIRPPTPQPATPSVIEMTGLFALLGGYDFDGANEMNATTCWGVGGYSDIREGLQVIIRDGSSQILASTVLVFEDLQFRCLFSWRAQNIKVSDFYSVEIGRRGELVYSHSDLVAMGFRVNASLGP
jgi:hypothetical protein